MLYFVIADIASDSLSISFSFFDICYSYLLTIAFCPKFIFIIPISPIAAIIVLILIKKMTPNKKLIGFLYKVKQSWKLKLIISILALFLAISLILLFSLLYSFINTSLLILPLLFAAMIVMFYLITLIIYLEWFLECVFKKSIIHKFYRLIRLKFLNNIFTPLFLLSFPVLTYHLCRVYFDIPPETFYYFVTPILIFLIFYIALSSSRKLNELIYFLYRKIIYVLLLYAYGIYYINTSNSPASPTLTAEAVKFAMIIITVVLLLRIPLYKLHQRSKKAYREVEQNM